MPNNDTHERRTGEERGKFDMNVVQWNEWNTDSHHKSVTRSKKQSNDYDESAENKDRDQRIESLVRAYVWVYKYALNQHITTL